MKREKERNYSAMEVVGVTALALATLTGQARQDNETNR